MMSEIKCPVCEEETLEKMRSVYRGDFDFELEVYEMKCANPECGHQYLPLSQESKIQAMSYHHIRGLYESLRKENEKENERLRQANHDEAVRHWDTMKQRDAALSMLRKVCGAADKIFRDPACSSYRAIAFWEPHLTEAKEFLGGVGNG